MFQSYYLKHLMMLVICKDTLYEYMHMYVNMGDANECDCASAKTLSPACDDFGGRTDMLSIRMLFFSCDIS